MRWAPAFQLVTMPLRIEHVERVVGDALDEELEAALGVFALVGLLDQPRIGAGKLGRALGRPCVSRLCSLSRSASSILAGASISSCAAR